MQPKRITLIAHKFTNQKQGIPDLKGMRFGKVVVIQRAGFNKYNYALWKVRCDCGKVCIKIGSLLIRGRTQSCGCRRIESAINRTTHGQSKDPIYGIWAGMIQRCTNPKRMGYKLYGGRGIRVCSRWLRSFENFAKDVGARPSLKHSLDRIDSNKNYTPSNVRWATRAEQGRNRRANVYLTFKKQTLCISEWARVTGINRATISVRLALGWPIERVLTEGTPAQRRTNAVVENFV